MKCKNCGEELEEGEKFCGNCGMRLPEHPQSELRKKRFPFIPLIVGVLLLVVAVILYLSFFSESAKNRKLVEEQLKVAERYLDLLDYEKAVAAYRAVLEIEPGNEEALSALEDTYQEWMEAEPERAEEICEEAERFCERMGSTQDEDSAKRYARMKKRVRAGIPENDPEKKTDRENDAEKEADPEEEEEDSSPRPTEAVKDESWKLLLREALEETMEDYYKNEQTYSYGDKASYYRDSSFQLVYIDEDTIPEIAVSPASGLLDGSAILYLLNGKVEKYEICWCDSVLYIPYSGKIDYQHGQHVPYCETVYT
ncbi:MAG: DUF2116 family Zn-ribbon domain-containing protein [Lachnospiraceae bacterium]|nr:DUF2116 family Zn-ribbon domain-containing protein [Lachnospiraceae bacterium]